MPRYSNFKIISLLRSHGFSNAADFLERYFEREFQFSFGHKKVLLILFIMGTLERPLKVPQRQSSEHRDRKITVPHAFWSAISWLFEGTDNSFKARYQELKRYTSWVEESDMGEYAITIAGVKKARELIEFDAKCRDFFYNLIYKIYSDDSKQARFFRLVLQKTDNFHPIDEEKIYTLLGVLKTQ